MGFEPLNRARQTAEILSLEIVRLEPAIIEMDWGAWEGHTRAELDEIYGEEVSIRAAGVWICAPITGKARATSATGLPLGRETSPPRANRPAPCAIRESSAPHCR